MLSCLGSFWRPRPRPRCVTELETTTSTCAAQAVRRKHVFVVRGYRSLLSRVGVGSFVRSDTFEVSGHDWAVRYFPCGDGKASAPGYASAFAVLLAPGGAEARASCVLTLVSRRLGVPDMVSRTEAAPVRHDAGGIAIGLGSSAFVRRSSLETSPSAYVRDDSITIECVVTVFKFRRASPSPAVPVAPPRTVSQDLANLLETKAGADVTFRVEGEVFAAHAVVLAMRSPVFKAELYGPMKERQRHIPIEDMQADVFRAMLHFIYTDSLIFPGTEDDRDGGDADKEEFVKHLLVAADRYDVQGLKLRCEKTLCESLTIASVAAMFALADQHTCSKLQDACVEFVTRSDTLPDVVASEGYRQLKSMCPVVMVELFEKATKSQEIFRSQRSWLCL